MVKFRLTLQSIPVIKKIPMTKFITKFDKILNVTQMIT